MKPLRILLASKYELVSGISGPSDLGFSDVAKIRSFLCHLLPRSDSAWRAVRAQMDARRPATRRRSHAAFLEQLCRLMLEGRIRIRRVAGPDSAEARMPREESVAFTHAMDSPGDPVVSGPARPTTIPKAPEEHGPTRETYLRSYPVLEKAWPMLQHSSTLQRELVKLLADGWEISVNNNLRDANHDPITGCCSRGGSAPPKLEFNLDLMENKPGEPGAPPEKRDPELVANALTATLAHEVGHALDPVTVPPCPPGMSKDDYREVHFQDSTRAEGVATLHMREIAAEIRAEDPGKRLVTYSREGEIDGHIASYRKDKKPEIELHMKLGEVFMSRSKGETGTRYRAMAYRQADRMRNRPVIIL